MDGLPWTKRAFQFHLGPGDDPLVFKLVVLDQARLGSVLVSAVAVTAALAALAALAATLAAVAAVAAPPRLYRHLRPLHRRSECPKLHSLAQLSVELRRQPGVLHHADCARHWSAPDSDLIPYGVLL